MGRSRVRRLLLTATGLILLVTVGAALSYGVGVAALGTAYKAKMLCSEVFVAGRDTDAVRADLVVDDLAALRSIDVSIDTRSKMTTASLYGLAESKVRYRDGLGCALANASEIAASWEIHARKGPARANRLRIKDGPFVEPVKSGSTENPGLRAVLDAAFSDPDPEHPQRTRAVVVLHEGRTVAERYAAAVGSELH